MLSERTEIPLYSKFYYCQITGGGDGVGGNLLSQWGKFGNIVVFPTT